jgi:hypothetical protein
MSFLDRFTKAAPREVPKTPQPRSEHDIATENRQTGAAIADMTERALADIRRAPIPASRQIQEPSEGSVIASLTKAALPQAARNSRSLQRVRAENELERQRVERTHLRAVQIEEF